MIKSQHVRKCESGIIVWTINTVDKWVDYCDRYIMSFDEDIFEIEIEDESGDWDKVSNKEISKAAFSKEYIHPLINQDKYLISVFFIPKKLLAIKK